MADRKWVPEKYMDEASPPPRDQPSDWIIRLPGDAYALAPADDLADDATDPFIVRDGDTVPFYWTQDHGSAILSVKPDKSWSVDRPPPDGVTHIMIDFEPETLEASIGEAVAIFLNGFEPDDGGVFHVSYYAWSDQPVSFRFDQATGTFVREAG